MIFEQSAREHIASRGAKETRAIYTADLIRWITFCALEAVDPDTPPFAIAVKFRDTLVDKFAGSTVRRILAELSSMYDAAGLINHFKSGKRLTRPAVDSIGATQEFSIRETEDLLKAVCNHPRDAAIIQILYDTGLRISEVLSIRRDQLHWRGDTVSLVAKVKKRGLVESVLPVTSALVIKQWLEVAPASRFLFPAGRGLGRIASSTFRERLIAIGKIAKVHNVHPHRFRATYITTALSAGIPLQEVQASVHHVDPNTTLRYDRGVRGTGVTTFVAEFRKGLAR